MNKEWKKWKIREQREVMNKEKGTQEVRNCVNLVPSRFKKTYVLQAQVGHKVLQYMYMYKCLY